MKESNVRAFTRQWVSRVYGRDIPVDTPTNVIGELARKAMEATEEQNTNSNDDNARANRLLASVFPNGI